MKRTLAIALVLVALAVGGATVLDRDGVSEPAALLRSPAAAPRTSQLELRLVAAESAYWRGAHDSARVAWEQLLADPVVASDSSVVADIQTWLSTVAWKIGDLGLARRIGEGALALKQRHGFHHNLQRSYNTLGLVAWLEGRLADGAILFQETIDAAARSGDDLTAAKAVANLGLIESELSRYQSARIRFEEALRLARKLQDAKLQGNALTNLGMVDVRIAQPAAALTKLESARGFYRSIDYPAGELNALGQLSTAYAALGDLQRAFATLDSANTLANRHDLKQEVASNVEILGDLYRDAGDAGTALRHYRRAKVLYDELGMAIERGTLLRKTAELQYRLGARTVAQASVQEAVRIHAATGADHEQLKDLLVAASHNPRSNALRQAIVLARKIDSAPARADVAIARARAEAKQGNAARALAILRTDSVAIEQTGFDAQSEAATLRAQLSAARGDHDVVARQTSAALAALERARRSLASGFLRASFTAHRADLYGDLIDAQLKVGRPDQALRVAEFARARGIGQIVETPDSADMLLQRIRFLTAKLNDEIDESEEPVLAESLRRELTAARLAFESIVARSGWQAEDASIADAAAIQAGLANNELLIEYFVEADGVYAFTASRERVTARRLAVAPGALTARIRALRDLMAPGKPPATEILHALHSDLLQPLANELIAHERITFVPHASLTYLPFAALRDRASGRYLVQDHVIRLVPNASFLARPLPARAELPPVLLLQPLPSELPGTGAEVKAVRSAWRSSRLIKGRRATSEALAAALDSDAIVHVASHAAVDIDAPLFSYVKLAQGKPNERLEVRDVLSRRIRAPLVYLSGCETGLGAGSRTGFESGADVSTFAQAFLASGAGAVVTTLWRIEDRSAADMAGAFYRELRSQDAAAALAASQRKMLRSKEYGSPFYWAAYTVTGEPRLRHSN